MEYQITEKQPNLTERVKDETTEIRQREKATKQPNLTERSRNDERADCGGRG